MTERTIMIGDHSVTVSDAAAIAVAGLQKENGTLIADNLKLTADLNTARDGHAAAIVAKDAELATARATVETKDGEIAVLKQQLADAQMTPAKLSAALATRNAVLKAAGPFLSDGYAADDKTEAQIRRDAVVASNTPGAATMSDAAIEGAFAALSAAKPAGDPLRPILAAGLQTTDAASPEARAAAAQAKRVDDMRNAWKGGAAA